MEGVASAKTGFGDEDQGEDTSEDISLILALSIDKSSVGAACVNLQDRGMLVGGALINDKSRNEMLAWVEAVLSKCSPDLVVVSTKLNVWGLEMSLFLKGWFGLTRELYRRKWRVCLKKKWICSFFLRAVSI